MFYSFETISPLDTCSNKIGTIMRSECKILHNHFYIDCLSHDFEWKSISRHLFVPPLIIHSFFELRSYSSWLYVICALIISTFMAGCAAEFLHRRWIQKKRMVVGEVCAGSSELIPNSIHQNGTVL